MSWIKQVFTDFQTVITAKFLNDLQDQIIADETTVSGMVKGVKGNSESSYRSGNVNITKANVGLGNVDNTSDANKPVSTAQQTALNGKVDKVTGKGLSTNDYTNEEKQKVADSALQSDLDDLTQQISDETTGLDTKAPVILETASGAIASFSDGADNMPIKSLVATIEPVQEGSGDPSPDNIRPISGWTGLTGARTGANYFTNGSENTSADLTKTNLSDTKFHMSGTVGSVAYSKTVMKWNDRSGTPFKIVNIPVVDGVKWFLYDGTDAKNLPGYSSAADYNGLVVTPPAEHSISLAMRVEPGVHLDMDFDVLACLVSDYEPFTVSWQDSAGTVYSGSVDVITGKLTITHIIYIMDGVGSRTDGLSFSKGGSTTRHEYFTLATNTTPLVNTGYVRSSVICSHYVTRNPNHALPAAFIGSGQLRIALPLTDERSSAELMNAWVAEQYNAGTPLCFLAQLASPIEYQLTPQEVTTLLGTNHVWTDVGPVEVTYPADTGLKIDEVAESVADTQSMLAPVVASNVATRSYAIGDMLIYDGKIYNVGVAIAEGETLSPGVNIEETSISGLFQKNLEVSAFDFDFPSTASGASSAISFRVVKTGYTPIGIVGFEPISSFLLSMVYCYISGGSIKARVRNNSEETISPAMKFYILFEHM